MVPHKGMQTQSLQWNLLGNAPHEALPKMVKVVGRDGWLGRVANPEVLQVRAYRTSISG